MQLVRAAVLLSLVGWCRTQTTLVSPCPSVFQYEAVGGNNGRWHGVISLPVNTVISSLWLNLVLDSNTRNNFNQDAISENVEFKIEHIGKRTSPAPAIEVRFYVNHNSGLSIPRLAEIRLNDKEICNVKTTGKTEKGTFYWIKLVGSQETKPAVSGLSSPGHVPSANNVPNTIWQPPPEPNPQVLVDQNRAGSVTASNNRQYKIKHINMGIFPKPGTSIEFYVHYDPNLRITTVTDIKLNGQQICYVESIQPISKTPVLKRGIATTPDSTTPKAWYNFIGLKDTENTFTTPSRSIYRGQSPPMENFSPLRNSGPGSESWLSYITVNKQAQRGPWPVPPTTKAQYPAYPETFNQQQTGPSSWMTYITGSGSTKAPPQKPVDQTHTTEFEIDDVEMRIYPAPETDIWFHVQYNPHEKIPKSVQIKLNGRDICSVGIASQSPSSLIDTRWGARNTANDY